MAKRLRPCCLKPALAAYVWVRTEAYELAHPEALTCVRDFDQAARRLSIEKGMVLALVCATRLGTD
jgi:hypothetical protein